MIGKPSSSSITTRLTIGLILGTTILWCLAATVSTYLSYRSLDDAFDNVLQEAAHRLLPLAADDAIGEEHDDDRAVRRFMDGRSAYLSYQLRDASGRIVLRSHDAPTEPYNKTALPGLSTFGDYRLFSDTDDLTGLTITVAETTRGRSEAIVRGMVAMLWPLVVLIPVSVLGISFVVRRAMQPVLRLSQQVAARGSNNLSPLDISDQPVELRPIAEATAHLVERLGAALDAERWFAANSAHELRTPIAGALAQTQRMLAELDRPEDRRRGREIEATLKRLAMLAEKLMQLSRADAGVGLSDEAVDLVPVLDLVVNDSVRRLDDTDRIRYTKADGARLVARMDLDAFAIVMRNLIDNAIIHGDAAGPIDIMLESDGRVRVVNDGPVVTSEILAGLKRRFARGESRSSGTGLGLAIVETIVGQTGGKLDLRSPVPGRQSGFEARLALPDAVDTPTKSDI